MRRIAVSALGIGFALLALALPAAAQDKIRIGTEAAYKPFAYVLPSGELTGFDIDIAKALCAQMQADCEIINQSFDGLIPALNAKKIDAIIASMSITAERQKAIDFAGPYYTVPALFIAPKDSGIEISPDGLAGKYVGVQRGTTMANYVAANFPKARVQRFRGAAGLPGQPGRRGLRGGGRAGLRSRDPGNRRRDRAAQGRHRAEGQVQQRAGRDHRLRRVPEDQREIHPGQHPAEVSPEGQRAA
jgi:hypothetical protein